jgi:hypothetical protein
MAVPCAAIEVRFTIRPKPRACIRACDRHQAIDIRVPHPLHLAVIEIREIATPEDAGIVDQNVDRAKLALQFLDHCAHGACITHVRGQRQCLPPRGPNFRGQRLGVRHALPVIDPDGGALARQPKCDSLSDST